MRLPSPSPSPLILRGRAHLRSLGSSLLRFLPLALVYFSSARIALLLAYERTNACPFWAPAGVALAAFAIFGRGAAVGIAVGAFCANAVSFVTNGLSDPLRVAVLSAVVAMGNTSAAYFGWRVLGRVRLASGLSWNLRQALRLLAAVVIASLTSALVGTSTLLAGTSLPRALGPMVFRIWSLGDAVGLLMIFPLVMTWWCAEPLPRTVPLRGRLLLAASLALLVTATFFWPRQLWPVGGLLLLPLLSLPVGSRRNTWLLAFAIASFLIWRTTNGSGGFASSDQGESALHLQLSLALMSVLLMLGTARRPERLVQSDDSGAGLLLGAAPDRRWSVSLLGLLIALLGVGVTLATWLSLLRAQEANTRRVTEAAAAALAEHFEARFADSVASVRRIAERWDDYGGLAEDLWRRDVKRYSRDHLGIHAVEWMDDAMVVRWVEPVEGNEVVLGKPVWDEPIRRATLARTRATGKAELTSAVELRQGGKGFILYARVAPPRGPSGYIVGVFKIEAVVAHIYGPRSVWDPTFFALQIWEGPSLLFSSHDVGTAVPAGAETARINVLGQSLTLRLLPQPAFLARETDTVPTLVLNAGLLLSVLLGTSMALMSLALDQARRARAASETKARFLATMSHEIRTPMTGILGAVDLALGRPLDAEAREHLVLVEQCGRTLQAIISDILDFSKIESGHLALEHIPFSLAEVAQQTVELFQGLARERNLALTLEVDPALPAAMKGDPVRVRQVMTNLLSNALKFTQAGTVTLVLELVAQQEEGSKVRIVCRDTGIGMDELMMANLFSPFVQGDASTTRRFGGTGLGLAIVKQLALAMGGDVRCASQPGMGTTFTLEFSVGFAPLEALVTTGRFASLKPLMLRSAATRLEPDAIHPAHAEGSGPPEGKREGKKRKVLLAEDSMVNQKLIAAMLKQQGCEVDVVSDGEAAVARATQGIAYDLIFMDMQMPIMDGLEACRRIRAASAGTHVPVVALTANAFDEDRRACHEAGMDGFLSKPVRGHHLREVLEKFVPPTGERERDQAVATVSR